MNNQGCFYQFQRQNANKLISDCIWRPLPERGQSCPQRASNADTRFDLVPGPFVYRSVLRTGMSVLRHGGDVEMHPAHMRGAAGSPISAGCPLGAVTAAGMEADTLVGARALVSSLSGRRESAAMMAASLAPNFIAFTAARQISEPAIKPTLKKAADSKRCVLRS